MRKTLLASVSLVLLVSLIEGESLLKNEGNWYQAPLRYTARRADHEGTSTALDLSLTTLLKTRQTALVLRTLNGGEGVPLWSQRGQETFLLLLGQQRGIAARVAASLTPFDEIEPSSQQPLLRNIYLTFTRFNYLLHPKSLPPFLQYAWEGTHQQFFPLLDTVDVNQSNVDGQTALMLAAARNHTALVKVLLQAGAQVEQKDRFGYTALSYASYTAAHPSIELLLAAYASPLAGVSVEKSPLFIAMVHENRPLAQLFFRVPSTAQAVNQTGLLGETLLMYAAVYGSLFQVEQLLLLGSQTQLQATLDRDALYFAHKGARLTGTLMHGQYQRIIQLLQQASATFK